VTRQLGIPDRHSDPRPLEPSGEYSSPERTTRPRRADLGPPVESWTLDPSIPSLWHRGNRGTVITTPVQFEPPPESCLTVSTAPFSGGDRLWRRKHTTGLELVAECDAEMDQTHRGAAPAGPMLHRRGVAVARWDRESSGAS
jgi:hypothetical protein